MSIQSEIARLQGVKSDILASIEAKNVIVPPGAMLADCPNLIESITCASSGVPYLKNIMPATGVKVVDENGYIGGNFLSVYYPNANYYNNFAIVIPDADYSDTGLGTVSFVDTTTTIGGRVYRTVTIEGVTWLAENLDFKFSGCSIGGSGTPSTPNAWYYNNDEATYGIDGTRKCGLMYNWYAVKLLNDRRSELIPGWHVPTAEEWDSLIDAVGGSSVAGARLKAANVDWATSWNGTDDYGMGILPGGGYSGAFSNVSTNAYYWTLSEVNSSSAYGRNFNIGSSIISRGGDKRYAESVRLVKDK